MISSTITPALGVEVLGISPDGGTKHQKFRAKYGLKDRAAERPRPRGDGALRGLRREDALWEKDRGRHPVDVSRRPRRQGRARLVPRACRRPRGQGAPGSRRADRHGPGAGAAGSSPETRGAFQVRAGIFCGVVKVSLVIVSKDEPSLADTLDAVEKLMGEPPRRGRGRGRVPGAPRSGPSRPSLGRLVRLRAARGCEGDHRAPAQHRGRHEPGAT